MKRIILTWASSGLGASIAKSFHQDGYEVVGLCRSQPADSIQWIKADLSDEKSVDSAVQFIQEKYSHFDVLIQCAGDGDGEEIDALDWRKTQQTFTLNAIAPIILTSKLLPLIKENKADVINVGATIAFKPYQYFSVYGSSKGAFRMWTENLQLELKGTSSRVIGVYPGGMNTKWNEKRGTQIKAISGKDIGSSFMNTDDIAWLLLQIINLPKNMEISEIVINRK